MFTKCQRHARYCDKALLHSNHNLNSTKMLPLPFNFRDQKFLILTMVPKLQMLLRPMFGTLWPFLVSLSLAPKISGPLLRMCFFLVYAVDDQQIVLHSAQASCPGWSPPWGTVSVSLYWLLYCSTNHVLLNEVGVSLWLEILGSREQEDVSYYLSILSEAYTHGNNSTIFPWLKERISQVTSRLKFSQIQLDEFVLGRATARLFLNLYWAILGRATARQPWVGVSSTWLTSALPCPSGWPWECYRSSLSLSF